MKCKLLFMLLVFSCLTNAYAQKYYSSSDFMNLKKENHIKYIINPDQLLSPKEEYSLNTKLDSIYKETGLDISIALFSNIKSILNETSEKFAVSLHSYWKPTLYSDDQDSSLIIVYHQRANDFGYYLGKSLVNSSLSPVLIDIKEEIYQEKNGKRKMNYTTIIQKLLPEIEKLAKEEKDKQDKNTIEKDTQRAKMMPIDIAASIIVSVVTLVVLYFWTDRKRRMAQRYDFIEDARAYLNNKIALISLFFLFLYPVIIAMISLLIGFRPGDTEYFLVVMGIFMFFGWIPTAILIQMQKGRLVGAMTSNREPLVQQPSSSESLRNLNNSQTGLDNVLQNSQQRQQETGNGSSQPQQKDSTKININTATSAQIRELSTLLTIVEVNRIVKERDTNGDYKNLRDLQRRTDLSTNILDKISSSLIFDPSSKSVSNPKGRTVDF